MEPGSNVRWAIAGRSQERLSKIRQSLCEQYQLNEDDIPILIASLDDAEALRGVVSQAQVVIAMAGPYALMGTPVVEAAMETGTHYVDITGEAPWVAKIIETYHERAEAKGLRIIPCCGYDSVPSDLGAMFVAEHVRQALGKGLASLRMVVTDFHGSVSGGTIASAMEMQRPGEHVARIDMQDVYALTPTKGPDRDFWGVEWVAPIKRYVTGFLMQVINNRIVHRSDYFLGYGSSFRYSETVPSPYWLGAQAMRAGFLAGFFLMSQTWLHGALKRVLPASGEGPSRKAMLEGHFQHTLIAKTEGPEPETVMAKVGWRHGDAGYWGASRMVLESALAIALEGDKLEKDDKIQKGGVLTPASGLGDTLLQRLKAAGFYFNIVDA
ncbi:hypothetical protein QBZ16_002677 [Prototheca wickerhamii]|uniref:Saccharopine dehydrogenase NADP binding domain-containing protein n=1 Tax=Prototheca wickerhamii TaxID=3111 RepID=A0AAD9IN19_PROWI|nr:hypothetical protein QBZ16_002677 [Prototheca wickerhamii]